MSKIIAIGVAAVLFLGLGTVAVRHASAIEIPTDLTLRHQVSIDGNAWLHIDLKGLDELKPLPDHFTVNVNLPSGFNLSLPNSFSGQLKGDVKVQCSNKDGTNC